MTCETGAWFKTSVRSKNQINLYMRNIPYILLLITRFEVVTRFDKSGIKTARDTKTNLSVGRRLRSSRRRYPGRPPGLHAGFLFLLLAVVGLAPPRGSRIMREKRLELTAAAQCTGDGRPDGILCDVLW